MEHTAMIVGTVEYRVGDGPTAVIRRGPVEVTICSLDATLSWVEEEVHGCAAIPIGDFNRYVKEGKIQLHGPPAA